MKIKPGARFRDNNTGRVIVVTKRAGGKHWSCVCGKKNHRLHEGTLQKFYTRLTSKDEN